MAAQRDLSPQEVLDSPHLLAGTPAQLADQLNGFRERFGITYWVFQDIHPFDQVLTRLTGD